MKSPDELRHAITKGRRITRDGDLLAALDALEELLNTQSAAYDGPSAEAIGLRRRKYQREYMRGYRKGIKRGGVKRCGPRKRGRSA